ncbi:MAG: ABC transporter substrate-binding protein [Rhodospirillaceae bacterium]|jgi:microcin C transport system substrate-binding protein|nr:ABC transporter substrate-binding protein [Rhodospirillaceae bacterium]
MMKKLTLFALTALLSLPLSALADTLDGVEGRHGIAMHGDLKYPADFKHFDYANPNAPKGGKVRMHSIGTFDSFNAFIVKGNAAAGIGSIYNTLMSGSADEAFSQYGELAQEVYMPDDRSWVAFKLRKEARWHDGKPVTVDDVIWTFNTLVKHGQPFYRFYYGSVADVVKIGADIVRFNFKAGENRELPLIIGQLAILPKHYWATRDFTKTTLEPPLGSGAYKVKDFEAGRAITVERVMDYWGRDLPINKGFSNFDEIRYDYYRDNTIAIEAFKAGEYDYRSENSSKSWATAYDIPAVKSGQMKKEGINHNRSTGMQGFVFNTRREMFTDARLRAALAYAFDFEWSNKNLFYGQYARSRSYFDNSELAAEGLPSADELKLLEPLRGKIPDEVFTKTYVPPKGGGPRQLRKNLRAAGKLLDAAGWKIKGRERVHEKTGTPLTFEVMLVSPLFERIVLPFAKNLEKLGVKITVRTVDSSQYRRRLDTYDFDMIVGSYGQSLSPGNEQRSYWGSKAATLEGGRNYMGISDPAIDELVEKVIAASDRKTLVTATRALDRVLQWGHWIIPHWHIKYDRIAYWNKFGRPKVTPTQGSQFTAWWVDAAKANDLAGRLASEKD